MSVRPQVIALEEHYLDPEVKRHIAADRCDRRRPHVVARLDDVGQGRIAEMDAAGIDIQVLSHGAPSGMQKVADAELAVRLARGANDRLAETVARPSRPFRRLRYRCRLPIRRPPPTNWNAPSPGSASRARWCMA